MHRLTLLRRQYTYRFFYIALLYLEKKMQRYPVKAAICLAIIFNKCKVCDAKLTLIKRHYIVILVLFNFKVVYLVKYTHNEWLHQIATDTSKATDLRSTRY